MGCERRTKSLRVEMGRQRAESRQTAKFALFSPFCFVQSLNVLDDNHFGKGISLLSLLIQMLVSS